MSWPRTPDGLRDLAGQLLELVGGRRDMVPHYYQFTPQGETEEIKGWAPWRGQEIDADYQLQEGEKDTIHKEKRMLLRPLNTDNVSLHLRGRKRLGVYPISLDETVRFLAADFDDHEGKLPPETVWAEVKNFWEICVGQELAAHIERSKSGTGYHVWIFFDGQVPAVKARAMGRYLLEEAGALSEDEDFDIFDRFFPSQSYLTDKKGNPIGKGIGNLIGLPMCGEANYGEGLNAWVDPDSGETIADGPAYVLDILERGRVPVAEVDVALDDWGITDLEERAEKVEYRERSGDEELGTEKEFDEVFKRCQFMQYAMDPDHQADIKEPLWFAMLSNGARFDVDDKLHKGSMHHSGYSSRACQHKIDYVRGKAPIGCQVIQRDGFAHCPAGGCQRPTGETVKSPAGLSSWVKSGKSKRPPTPPVEAYEEQPVKMVGKAATATQKTEQPKQAEGEQLPAETSEEEKPEQEWPDDLHIYECSGLPWPIPDGGWEVESDGVWEPSKPVKDGKGQIVNWIKGAQVAKRSIWVDAITRDQFGNRGGVLKFLDYDEQIQTVHIPLRRLSEAGGKLGMDLRDQGMPLIAGKEKNLCRYLDESADICMRRAMTANKLGWFDGQKKPVFVMPESIIGGGDKNAVIFQTNHMLDTNCISSDGSLQEWKDRVAAPCKGNPLLMFAALCSLAGPFLKLCRGESAGFHFYGATSGGKTTLLQVAASVWGDGTDPQEGADHTSIRKWHSTGNALEATAQLHNDMALCLDEVGQVDPSELGNIIYMLSGGQPKGRSTVDGGLKQQLTWRLLFLSNGEMTVGQILAQAGQAEKGGQRHRLPDIPCDNPNGDGSGVVLNTNGEPVKAFVDDIKEACGETYGHAGPVLVAWLIAQIEQHGFHQFVGNLREETKTLEQHFRSGVDLPNDGGRVVKRMAIIALAGMYAGQAGITPWSESEINQTIFHVRNLWLKELGEERSEEDRALAYFRSQLLKKLALFRSIHNEGEIRDGIGVRGNDYIMPFTDSMIDLSGTFDQNMILKELKKKGLLKHQKDRLSTKSPVLKGQKLRPNVYAISERFLGELHNGSMLDEVWDNNTYEQGKL